MMNYIDWFDELTLVRGVWGGGVVGSKQKPEVGI